MRKLGNIDGRGKLVRTFEMRRSVTEDVVENRFVRHVTEHVRGRLVALPRAETAALLRELDAATHLARFLREAGPLTEPIREPTAVLAQAPLYRAVYETWMALRRADEAVALRPV